MARKTKPAKTETQPEAPPLSERAPNGRPLSAQTLAEMAAGRRRSMLAASRTAAELRVRAVQPPPPAPNLELEKAKLPPPLPPPLPPAPRLELEEVKLPPLPPFPAESPPPVTPEVIEGEGESADVGADAFEELLGGL